MNNEIVRYGFLKEKGIRKLEEVGPDMGDARNYYSQPYELIMQSELNGTIDRVAFNANYFKESYRTEVLLRGKDFFMFDRWGLFMLDRKDSWNYSYGEHTFPDRCFFTPWEVEEGNVLYHGNLSLSVNNYLALKDVRADRFRMDESEVERRRRGLSDGMCDMPEMGVLSGSKNNRFILDLPRKSYWGGSCAMLRLRLKGVLFQSLIEYK